MAENGRVHPDCANASNPYHECGVACLEKLAQGKGRKEKKKTDNRGGTKPGELGKKVVGDMRTNSNCPKASNPFHQCGEYCPYGSALAKPRGVEKDSGSFILDADRSFGRKKKVSESQPKAPMVNSHVSPVNAAHPADNPSPRSPVHDEKRVESGINQIYSSRQQYQETQSEDRPFNNGRDRSSESVVKSGNGTHDDPKGPSKVNRAGFDMELPTKEEEENEVHQEDNDVHQASHVAFSGPIANNMREVSTNQPVKSFDFTFSGISRVSQDSDEQEVQSVISDSCVSVGRYHVKTNIASILQLIFDKYGDVAADCRLESTSMRAYYLECLCAVVQELQSTPFTQLTKSKIKEMLAVLKDVESACIDVTWLRGILNELTEAMDLKTTEFAKANCDRAIESTKKELETLIKDLAQKEKEVADAKAQIAETQSQLSELELESSRLSDVILSSQSKINKFQSKPFSYEIF